MPARDRFPVEGASDGESIAFNDSVREQLMRILRSHIFMKAPSLSRFLSYIVERSLTESAQPLNEYSLGVDVFQRGDSFDPTVDTIVRVQARRLRSKLQQYYASEGHADPIVVDMPKGQYSAIFWRRNDTLSRRSSTPFMPSSMLIQPSKPAAASSENMAS